MVPPLGSLRLRPPTISDEAEVVAAHRQMAIEQFTFALRWREDLPWAAYLALLEGNRIGTAAPEGLVPAAFLVAEVDGAIIGRASVRYELNELLAQEGGHIGYCVLPAYRRRGHATEILRQGLIVARAAGVDRVLVTCDDDNVGSRVVIERCGGKFADIVTSQEDDVSVRRYWID